MSVAKISPALQQAIRCRWEFKLHYSVLVPGENTEEKLEGFKAPDCTAADCVGMAAAPAVGRRGRPPPEFQGGKQQRSFPGMRSLFLWKSPLESLKVSEFKPELGCDK